MEYKWIIIPLVYLIVEVVHIIVTKSSFIVSTFKEIIEGVKHLAEGITPTSGSKKEKENKSKKICSLLVITCLVLAILIFVTNLSSFDGQTVQNNIIIMLAILFLFCFVFLKLIEVNRRTISRS